MEKDLDKIIELTNKMKEKMKNKLDIKVENGRRYFEYCGIRYEEFNPNKFVAKNILSKKIIDDIVDDKRYLDSAKDARYNSDIFDISWENSFIRKILNSTFKEKYLSDLEINGEVRCLTKEEAENLPDDLKETERYGYWTMSPYYADNDSWANVFRVNAGGNLSYVNVTSACGVRPVFMLKVVE